MSDFVYVLGSRGSVQMNKRFRLLPNGTIQKTAFDPQSCPEFHFERRALTSFDALCSLLDSLRKQPQRALVRGDYIGDPEALLIRRRKRGEGASFTQAEGHHWVCVDIDKFKIPWDEEPEGPDDSDYHYAAAVAARQSLPAPFQQARALCHLSSSYGYGGEFRTFKGHLWFWFDRPVCDDALRQWKELTDASDPALYDCIQIHYTADPTFDSLEPFIPEEVRMFELYGEQPTVIAPDFLTTLSEMPKPEPKPGVAKAEKPTAPPPAPVFKKQVSDIEHDGCITTIAPTTPPTHSQLEYGKRAIAGILDDAQGWAPGNRHRNIYKKACHLARLANSGLITVEQRDQTAANILRGLYADDPAQFQKETHTITNAFEECAYEYYDLEMLCPSAPPKPAARSRKDYEARATRGEGPRYVDFNEKGMPDATENNIKAAMDYLNITFGHDLMSREDVFDCPVTAGMPAYKRQKAGRAKLIRLLDQEKIYRGPEWLEQCLTVMQIDMPFFHAPYRWMCSVPWDGVDRIETLFQTLQLAASTTEQQRAFYFKLFRRWLISAARAAAVPVNATTGIDAQGVLVLQGHQNAGKSRWFKSLCGVRTIESGAFIAAGEDPINKHDSVRKMEQLTSRWITEFAEIDHTIRKMDEGEFKAFVSCSTDRWVPKWGTGTCEYPRRCVYAGTVNQENFMKDPTGNRRLWVIPVKACYVEHTDDMSVRVPGPCVQDINMQQLWAQVAFLERKGPAAEPHFLNDAELAELNAANDLMTVTSIHEVNVEDVFEGLPAGTPTGKWMAGSEARAHYLKCCNLADNDPSAPAVWAKASHDIQKRWGPRQKNSVVRYAVKKRL